MSLSGMTQEVQGKIDSLFRKIQAYDTEAREWLTKADGVKGSGKQMYQQKCGMALRKKKEAENQLKMYSGQLNMLDTVAMNQETVKANKEMVEQMEYAVKANKEVLAQVDLDKFDKLQDEMLEAKFQSNYMNEMLSRNYDVGEQEELEEEFAALEKEMARDIAREKAREQKKPIVNSIPGPQKGINLEDLDRL